MSTSGTPVTFIDCDFSQLEGRTFTLGSFQSYVDKYSGLPLRGLSFPSSHVPLPRDDVDIKQHMQQWPPITAEPTINIRYEILPESSIDISRELSL